MKRRTQVNAFVVQTLEVYWIKTRIFKYEIFGFIYTKKKEKQTNEYWKNESVIRHWINDVIKQFAKDRIHNSKNTRRERWTKRNDKTL